MKLCISILLSTFCVHFSFAQKYYEVTAFPSLKIHTKPGSTTGVNGFVDYSLVVQEEDTTVAHISEGDYEWVKIKTVTNQTGWVCKNYLSETESSPFYAKTDIQYPKPLKTWNNTPYIGKGFITPSVLEEYPDILKSFFSVDDINVFAADINNDDSTDYVVELRGRKKTCYIQHDFKKYACEQYGGYGLFEGEDYNWFVQLDSTPSLEIIRHGFMVGWEYYDLLILDYENRSVQSFLKDKNNDIEFQPICSISKKHYDISSYSDVAKIEIGNQVLIKAGIDLELDFSGEEEMDISYKLVVKIGFDGIISENNDQIEEEGKTIQILVPFDYITLQDLRLKAQDLLPQFQKKHFKVKIDSSSYLKLRNSPDVDSEILKKLSPDEVVTYLYCEGYSYRTDDDQFLGYWVNVKTIDGIEGWVVSSFLELVVESDFITN